MTSLPGVPLMTSGPCVPTIVAARPRHDACFFGFGPFPDATATEIPSARSAADSARIVTLRMLPVPAFQLQMEGYVFRRRRRRADLAACATPGAVEGRDAFTPSGGRHRRRPRTTLTRTLARKPAKGTARRSAGEFFD